MSSDLPDDILSHLSYAVFGLGDSGYTHFNWAAKILDRRLASLGAQTLIERGDGDERHYLSYDGSFLPWSKNLFNSLELLDSLPAHLQKLNDDYLPPPKFKIEFLDDNKSYELQLPKRDNFSYECKIRKNQRMTDPSWYQDVRHIEIDIPSSLKYDAGDVAILYPTNDSKAVNDLINLLNWTNIADKLILIKPNTQKKLPKQLQEYTTTPTTIRSLLTFKLSPFSVPRLTFFEYLKHFAGSQFEKDRLKEFSSSEGADDLYDYCTRVRRNHFEVISDFKTIDLPYEYLIDLFPLLRPRKFSIASYDTKRIDLCIALVMYKTKLMNIRKGICSNYVYKLQPGDILNVGIENGTIGIDKDDNNYPLILVGPGTGIAPMRAIIKKRLELNNCKNTSLYFGCRKSGMDELYKSELENIPNLILRIAHSRDDESGIKEYVQNLLQIDGKRVYIWLIERKGKLFISG